ncbi:12737_t:CDS:2 [Ambispora leptoticha]|uniref:Autophagy-related protein 27 n=1 Tax=Ambispora leptoticha TaxID=144679 RepID=A0A9N8VJ08_9GLOM|nr:12737_t:CDS:2 [Ambispora leptoticha]
MIKESQATPPTKKEELYYLSPCKPLNTSLYEDKDNEEDYCAENTYVLQQLAADDEKNELLNATFSLGSSENIDNPHAPLLLTLNAGTDKQGETHQTKFTFICDKDSEEKKKPTFKSYEKGILEVEWKTPHACGEKYGEPDENNGGRGGFTKFLTIFLILILTYLGIGAAYNYHVYRAQGWDLIPNRDFWRDVPYLISDMFKYLARAFHGGRGYSGV